MEERQTNYTISEGYELPSKGLIYEPKISSHVELRSMTARDEMKRLAGSTAKFKVLCECKQYTSSVSREKVAVLHDKIESIGAHKGILLATSDFQSGAIQYAKAHGIALITVEDHTLKNHSFSNESGILDENDPFAYGVLHMPPVVASVYSEDMNEPQRIYPTRAMIGKLMLEQTKRINEAYGTDIKLPFIVEEDE